MELVGERAEFLETIGPGLRLDEGRAGMAEPPPSEGWDPQDVINVPKRTGGTPYFQTPMLFIGLP